MNRSLVRTLLIVLAAVVLVLGAGGALVWWKISSLKERLLAQLGDAIGAQVTVASIDIDFFKGELHAAGISLVNQRSSAPWQKGDISQATVHFHLRDLFASSLPLTVDVASWNVVLHSPLRTAETPPAPEQPGAPDPTAGGKGRIQVTNLTAQDGKVEVDFSDDRKLIAQGVSFDAADNGAGIWTTQLKATSLTADSLKTGPSSVQLRGEQDKITFSDLKMQCDPGYLTGEGDVALDGAHALRVNLKAVDLPLTMLVATQWQMELSGLTSGDMVYKGDDHGGEAKGQISVSHGKFNVLPWIGKLTAMVGLQDISNVEVDKATSDMAWKDGSLHLTNIDVRKNDVTRIAGAVDVDPRGQVDGHLKLGLPSTITAKWPQLQTQVFPVALEDYNWTEVQLTGTADHLQEDLSSRVLAAGLGQGGDLLNSAAQKATDLFHSLMGK